MRSGPQRDCECGHCSGALADGFDIAGPNCGCCGRVLDGPPFHIGTELGAAPLLLWLLLLYPLVLVLPKVLVLAGVVDCEPGGQAPLKGAVPPRLGLSAQAEVDSDADRSRGSLNCEPENCEPDGFIGAVVPPAWITGQLLPGEDGASEAPSLKSPYELRDGALLVPCRGSPGVNELRLGWDWKPGSWYDGVDGNSAPKRLSTAGCDWSWEPNPEGLAASV